MFHRVATVGGVGQVCVFFRTTPPLHSWPAGEPQLTDYAVLFVAVPADDMCLYHCSVAANDISHWRSKTTATGAGRSSETSFTRLLASDVRARLIAKTDGAGFHQEAQRLALQGAAGFPDESNFALISGMLGGGVASSVGQTYLVKGTGPVVMHIGFDAAVDGAGHGSGHFQLYQIHLPLRTRDEASVDDVNLSIGLALLREPSQTRTQSPLLCRQPSVARVPRSLSRERIGSAKLAAAEREQLRQHSLNRTRTRTWARCRTHVV